MNNFIRILVFVVASSLGGNAAIICAHEVHQQQQPLVPAKPVKTLEIQSQQELQVTGESATKVESQSTKDILLSIGKWVGISLAAVAGAVILFFAGISMYAVHVIGAAPLYSILIG
ncbi:MAG TPA: hypothetical protein VLG71_03575 [Candidatus Limnocylindria bacterium]|nr:hypothetical protein [Candidatus Limnocylindria bacterium]